MSLSESARQLYLTILYGVPVASDADEVLQELLAWGLVVAHPQAVGQYLPLDPRTVATQRRDQALVRVAEAMQRATALPEHVQDLAIAYQHVAPGGAPVRGAVEYVAGLEAINSRISELVATTTTEILTAHPDGPRPAETLALALPRDLDALHRGISMRVLYRTSVRSDGPTSQWALRMTREGARVKTLDQPFVRCILLDRRKAVLEDYTPWTGPGPEPRRVLIVHDEGLVQYVLRAWERDWARGTTWRGEELPAESHLTEVQRAIMRHLATGAGQKAVAEALGMSERSVSAQLAEMRRVLGYESTVQMAYELGRRAALEELT
ncbi:LuxR C-terminal-related transcriptional regulator [Kitasatospora purpeofusca]|uniref:LuxR C-terminal-related transcriptional regulator n=1 Tax=Kitasatospora purpeofusca TaxID=67352 RepID=UPI003662879E